MIDLTPIFQAVLALLAALITYKLIPWIKARTTNEQQARIDAAIRVAVYAAEQVYGAGNGAQKKAFAVAYLEEHGFTVDSAAIEAAVCELLNLSTTSEMIVETDTPPDGLTDDGK